ncbi:threonine-phosphate decarboxylase [Sphingomonas aracearum]|nr:threonine-phosphate decarboxylase [Sphingomonas aracearum]
MRQAESHHFLRHGGRLDAARAAWPDAPGPWIDLSTGINPKPWQPAAPIPHDLGPLPDAGALLALEAAAAAHFGVAAERVAAVPGSEIALRLLPAIGLPEPIGSVGPGYRTHRDVARGSGEPRTLLLANPNNPDGRLHRPDALLALVEQQRGREGWLVVDEAFADVHEGAGIAAPLTPDDPVIVLRSFGKFFGLAGLRLGFVIAPPAVLARFRAYLGDWPVSAQAIAWGTAAYADGSWIADTRASLREQAGRLDALLRRHGLEAQGACPLFRLVDHRDAGAVFERLSRRGILTRPFEDRPSWLRFGLPADGAAFDRLDKALAGG